MLQLDIYCLEIILEFSRDNFCYALRYILSIYLYIHIVKAMYLEKLKHFIIWNRGSTNYYHLYGLQNNISNSLSGDVHSIFFIIQIWG